MLSPLEVFEGSENENNSRVKNKNKICAFSQNNQGWDVPELPESGQKAGVDRRKWSSELSRN